MAIEVISDRAVNGGGTRQAGPLSGRLNYYSRSSDNPRDLEVP
jgi:hypothetical protein